MIELKWQSTSRTTIATVSILFCRTNGNSSIIKFRCSNTTQLPYPSWQRMEFSRKWIGCRFHKCQSNQEFVMPHHIQSTVHMGGESHKRFAEIQVDVTREKFRSVGLLRFRKFWIQLIRTIDNQLLWWTWVVFFVANFSNS